MKVYKLAFFVVFIIIFHMTGCKTKKPTTADSTQTRYLLVTADDFCLSESITNGIIEAYKQEKG